MKSLLILFVAFLSAGCSSNSTNVADSSNFSADLNGSHWVPTKPAFGVHDSGQKEMWIDVEHGPIDDRMGLYFPDSLRPGTYSLGLGAYSPSQMGDWYYGYSGTLTLSSISLTRCSGTFEYKARLRNMPDSIFVTNGKFDVQVGYGLIPF